MKNKFKSFLVALMYMLIGFIVQFIISIIGGMIIAVTFVAKQGPDSFVGAENAETTAKMTNEIMSNMNYMLLASSIFTILTFMLIFKLRKKKLTQEILLKSTKKLNYGVALILGVSVWLFNMGFVTSLSKLGLFQSSFDSLEKTMSFMGESNIFLSVLVIGIVAPFAEELLFRGIIYKTLSKSMSIPAVIIIQGVLFGVYHLNLVQGLYATFLGILFGYVTYKTKSLWPAIIMHMVNNIVATISPSILGDSIEKGLETTVSIIMLLVVGFIITAVGTLAINNHNKLLTENINEEIEVEN